MRQHVLAIAIALSMPLSAGAQSPAQGHPQSRPKTHWKVIGTTAAKNIVYIDPASVRKANGIITARLQVRFIEPVKAVTADWRLSRHIAMFNCAKKTIAAKSTTYFSDSAGTKVVETKLVSIPGFGPAIGGSMTQIALDYVCTTYR
jgi:hypothetical protein